MWLGGGEVRERERKKEREREGGREIERMMNENYKQIIVDYKNFRALPCQF